MPLPSLRADGTLPPGAHQATLNEALAAYPAYNQQRQILNDSLQRVVEEVQRLDPTITIYVDGSYVTRKAEPNDVDLLLVTLTFTEEEIKRYLAQVCPVELVSLDITVESQLPSVIFDLFTESRRGQQKGIIQVQS